MVLKFFPFFLTERQPLASINQIKLKNKSIDPKLILDVLLYYPVPSLFHSTLLRDMSGHMFYLAELVIVL